jgi:glutamate formiminotransferase
MSVLLECVINLSASSGAGLTAAIEGAKPVLLDRHSDGIHNRTVLTLGGEASAVEAATRRVATAGVQELDLRAHAGVHPRFGVLDVVPFVPLTGATMTDAIVVRDRFAAWAGAQLRLPCFLYGIERTLPEVRKGAFTAFGPDTGPAEPHPTAGACAVGARPPLVAYNLSLTDGPATAKQIAAGLRSEHVRALGFEVGSHGQVSCNLVAPDIVGPAEVFDAVAAQAEIDRAELVGLIPESVLTRIPPGRWPELDLAADRTIESRLR